jgi:hypothetical protein
MPLFAEGILIVSPTHAVRPGVPVTAKLSKRFYDVLGEDVANELVDWFNAVDLTYRTDLRELNDLNFARFDAKLEQRLAELRAELLVELRTGLQQVRTELVRWMFGFWVSTLLGIAGLLIALRG